MRALLITAVLVALLPLAAAGLECEVQASSTCSAGWEKYLGLENETGGFDNAHAQTRNYSGTTYANSVCCRSVYSGTMQHSCSEGEAFARLASEDNAHVQVTNTSLVDTTYSVDACISHSESTTSCRATSDACSSSEACVLSLSSEDNAHAASCGFYGISVCCSLDTDPADDFITTWKTDNPGPSNNDQITLPLQSSGTYSFTVDWGDGSSDTITQWNQSETTHTYASAGTYNVTISGTLEGWRFNGEGDEEKLLDIKQWGSMRLGNSGNYFQGASNLQITANDTPDLTGTSNFDRIFNNADLSTTNNLSGWDVSGVTSMDRAFRGSNFNEDISSWDVSSVTNFQWVFGDATQFNQTINSWNTSGASGGSMRWFFHGATSFNQPVDNFDVSKLTNLRGFFGSTHAFNQDLSSWDVSSVTSFRSLFQNAQSFNRDISMWNVSSVSTMERAFLGATDFDQDLSAWNISSVTNMVDMFAGSGGLSTSNYDSTLINWSVQSLQSNVQLDAPNSFYSLAAADERQSMIDTYNWTINDAGVTIDPPTLLTPTNNNLTLFERRPEFTWSNLESDDSYHQINITAPAGCSSIPITNSSTLSYNPPSDLCVDEVYEWTVRTCLEATCSDWAAPYNFSIESVVSIEMIGNETNFGSLSANTSVNTVEDATSPLVINNTGNVAVNTDVRALNDLWSNQPLNTSYFQYADEGSTNWQNMSSENTPHTTSLLRTVTRAIEIRVQVPQNEPPGDKSSTVQATAEAAE